MAVIAGTSGNDSLSGAGAADTIEGFGGYDTLAGGAGNDVLSGGEADDLIVGGGIGQGGADTIDGGAGRYDVLSYDYSASTAAVSFKSTVASGTQKDPLDNSIDTITGIEEVHLFGGQGSDRLSGDAMNDIIAGGRGNDTLSGGGGNDAFWWNADEPSGNDVVTDLAAYDELTFDGLQLSRLRAGNDPSGLKAGELMLATPSGGTTKLYVRLGEGAAGGTLSTITLVGVFSLADFSVDTYGSFSSELSVRSVGAGDDYLLGGSAAELIDGQTGDDWISGYMGNDTLTGGGGHDAFVYDALYEMSGRDTITDLGANDVVVFERVQATGFVQGVAPEDLQAGQMQLQSTAGAATTLLHLQTGGEQGLLTIVLQGSFTTNDFTLSHNEYSSRLEVKTVAGEAERFHGSYRDDSVVGGQGDDTLAGFYGDDTLEGGAGADFIDAGAGADLLAGGTGDDSLRAGDGTDVLHGENGDDRMGGGARSDVLDGGAGNDTVYGDAGNDTASGGAGDDNLYGGAGTDSLLGGIGNDVLGGNAGADRLEGGAGADVLVGGTAADTFIFRASADSRAFSAARDTIQDFSHAEGDLINLYLIDAREDIAGNQVFQFIGSGAFTGQEGQLRTMASGGSTFVYGDTNGDKVADFGIQLTGVAVLTAGDFIL